MGRGSKNITLIVFLAATFVFVGCFEKKPSLGQAGSDSSKDSEGVSESTSSKDVSEESSARLEVKSDQTPSASPGDASPKSDSKKTESTEQTLSDADALYKAAIVEIEELTKEKRENEKSYNVYKDSIQEGDKIENFVENEKFYMSMRSVKAKLDKINPVLAAKRIEAQILNQKVKIAYSNHVMFLLQESNEAFRDDPSMMDSYKRRVADAKAKIEVLQNEASLADQAVEMRKKIIGFEAQLNPSSDDQESLKKTTEELLKVEKNLRSIQDSKQDRLPGESTVVSRQAEKALSSINSAKKRTVEYVKWAIDLNKKDMKKQWALMKQGYRKKPKMKGFYSLPSFTMDDEDAEVQLWNEDRRLDTVISAIYEEKARVKEFEEKTLTAIFEKGREAAELGKKTTELEKLTVKEPGKVAALKDQMKAIKSDLKSLVDMRNGLVEYENSLDKTIEYNDTLQSRIREVQGYYAKEDEVSDAIEAINLEIKSLKTVSDEDKESALLEIKKLKESLAEYRSAVEKRTILSKAESGLAKGLSVVKGFFSRSPDSLQKKKMKPKTKVK